MASSAPVAVEVRTLEGMDSYRMFKFVDELGEAQPNSVLGFIPEVQDVLMRALAALCGPAQPGFDEDGNAIELFVLPAA